MRYRLCRPRRQAGLRVKKPSRQGRYRKVLMAPEQIAPIAQNLAGLFQDLDGLRRQGRLSDAEFLGYGLLALLACRQSQAFQTDSSRGRKQKEKQAAMPADLTSAPSSPPADAGFRMHHFWELLQIHALPIAANAKSLSQNLSLLDFLACIRLRGIPDSARMALLAWLEGLYPLTLTFHIPSGEEVFTLQKRGGRCVTFFIEAHELTALHHERDILSFTVHDLMHAHEFYANAQRATQQIGFYHWLDGIRHHAGLQKFMAESPAFAAMWDYVLSDMNSYCGHLLKTLHAAFLLHGKPTEGEDLWRQVVRDSGLNAEEQALFLKVNSLAWGEREFLQLEKVLENMAA